VRIHFESWIKEQDVSGSAQTLFNESIMCYRVGAYRAAFIMSYLGFFRTIKDRLLNSDVPELIYKEDWKKTINDLNNDEIWEETVMKTIEEKTGKKRDPISEKRSKVFLIKNDLIREVHYWRQKRNECAHAKDTIIGNSHVEMFWLFLQSNLGKFVINGGKQALFEKISKHFDNNYTRPGTDFLYLIKEIPLVARRSEIPNLLKELHENYVDLFWSNDKQEYLFWKHIAFSDNKDIQESLLTYITSNKEIFLEFIDAFPELLLLCTDNEELMRQFWKEILFENVISRSFWKLAISLLTSDIIPMQERKPFIKKLSGELYSGSLPDKEQTEILKKFGLLNILRQSIFVSGNLNTMYTGYNNANKNDQRIIFYLDNAPLDVVVVEQLNTLFKSYNRGDLYDRMETFMEREPRFIFEFREIANKEGIKLADFFKEHKEVQEEHS